LESYDLHSGKDVSIRKLVEYVVARAKLNSAFVTIVWSLVAKA
jgi:hypothetical protein